MCIVVTQHLVFRWKNINTCLASDFASYLAKTKNYYNFAINSHIVTCFGHTFSQNDLKTDDVTLL